MATCSVHLAYLTLIARCSNTILRWTFFPRKNGTFARRRIWPEFGETRPRLQRKNSVVWIGPSWPKMRDDFKLYAPELMKSSLCLFSIESQGYSEWKRCSDVRMHSPRALKMSAFTTIQGTSISSRYCTTLLVFSGRTNKCLLLIDLNTKLCRIFIVSGYHDFSVSPLGFSFTDKFGRSVSGFDHSERQLHILADLNSSCCVVILAAVS